MCGVLLIADDENETREKLSLHFQTAGYGTATAENGTQVLDYIETHHVDIVISDITLPGMDGTALLDEIHRQHAMIHVIIIAENTTLDSALACMRHQADTCIFKPLDDLSELETAVENAFHTIETWNRKFSDLNRMKLQKIFSDEPSIPAESEVTALFEACANSFTDNNSRKEITSALNDIRVLSETVGLQDPVARDTVRSHISHLEEIVHNSLTEYTSGSRTNLHRKKARKTNTGKPRNSDSPSTAVRKKQLRTMRIPEESIDNFLNYVGELITLGEMYTHFRNNFSTSGDTASSETELHRINEMFNTLSSSLQNSLLSIRQLSMRSIMQKIPRIVRDISHAQEKEIRTRLSGQSVMVDKSIIDALKVPVTHIVRNAAVHGIEQPHEREAAGKHSSGIINVSAAIEGDEVLVSISDDGRGLDLDTLKNSAVNRGLISADSELSRNDVINLIFQTDVASPHTETNIPENAGGLNAARQAIVQKGGTIEVSTIEGKGSEFTIRLPISVSTIIMKGFIIGVADTRFILPIEHVDSAFAIEPGSLFTIAGEKGTFVKKDGRLIPSISLSTCLDFSGNGTPDEKIMILLSVGRRRLAVSVDETPGIRQCVLKSIEGMDIADDYIKGAAIMGDSSVALVLDVNQLIERYGT